MRPSRRDVLVSTASMMTACAAGTRLVAATQVLEVGGNPILPGLGVCDPQVRIYGDVAWMYSTHDASPDANWFTMNDWQIWRSTNLVDWSLAGRLTPEQTYLHHKSNECWATDGAEKNGKYYLYFSMGPEDIGVVMGDTPAGPWRDPIGKPLIAKGGVPTSSRDPGILQEPDGTSYIVFGTFDYYIARLGDDMVSLAEKPRLIEVHGKTGPFGVGKTDDKPFLHRRGDFYYLSWGSYYAMGRSPYGPFDFKSALLKPENVDATFLNDSAMRGPHAPPPQFKPQDWLNFDRHASFFEYHGQWYFACNDQSLPGATPLFRNTVLSYVHYRDDGTIAPIRLTENGVGGYDGRRVISAADFFAINAGAVRDDGPDSMVTLSDGGSVSYPNVRNLMGRRTLNVRLAGERTRGTIEVRRGTMVGRLLGEGRRTEDGAAITVALHGITQVEDICLIARGGISISSLTFS